MELNEKQQVQRTKIKEGMNKYFKDGISSFRTIMADPNYYYANNLAFFPELELVNIYKELMEESGGKAIQL